MLSGSTGLVNMPWFHTLPWAWAGLPMGKSTWDSSMRVPSSPTMMPKLAANFMKTIVGVWVSGS